MKNGDKTDCPHCGQSTFVREKIETDGWQIKDKVLICAFCGGTLGHSEEEEHTNEESDDKNASSLSGLTALLGVETQATSPRLDATPEEARFCRDCVHYVAHPFLSRCELHHTKVNPMDDCPEFHRKPESEN